MTYKKDDYTMIDRPEDLVRFTTSLALSDAVQKGIITDEAQHFVVDTANTYMKALLEGKGLMKERGKPSQLIEREEALPGDEPDDVVLTIGDDE